MRIPKECSPNVKLSHLTRRDFTKLNAASLGMLSAGIGPAWAVADSTPQSASRLLDVDVKALISRSNLHYLSPVEKSVEGQPIGNGRMGTMVWTTPSAIHFQINRAGVFAVNRNHIGKESFPRFTDQDTVDVCGACAQITLDVGGTAFAGKSFKQDLSLYEAECQLSGAEIQARCFVSAMSDVLVLEIEDNRSAPAPIQLTLSLWGKPSAQRGNHLSRFAFTQSTSPAGDLPVVTRTFTEGEYYCASGVAMHADVPMQRAAVTETEQTFLLQPSPSKKKMRILISSAGTMDAKTDIAARAVAPIAAAASQSTDALQRAHRTWWANYWSRTFVHLSSADGVAEFVEQLRTVYLYVMASSWRGSLPAQLQRHAFHHRGR